MNRLLLSRRKTKISIYSDEIFAIEGHGCLFCTEEAHAVMLAYAAYGGGRAALKVTPISLNL